ncbi:MAG TPA: hypothetical protein VF261_02550 [Candidatus Saccharimonadales bacterium]
MKNFLSGLKAQKDQQRRAEINKSLIHYEAKLGGELFGPVAEGGRREFFCLDEHTWVWHEEWIDGATGQRRALTTRYDVRPSGILKSQGGNSYQRLSPTEAKNFYRVVELYDQKVRGEYARMLQTA